MVSEETNDEGRYQDSFTIGTAAKGGGIKVYFRDIRDPDAMSRITTAMELYNKLQGGALLKEELSR